MSEADAAFPMDALLREREWVRALARSLVRSAEDADDLEQDAWVEALRRPPADARSPRGWLATVLYRLAGRGRRSAARVRRREQAAARPEALPATADLVAVAEQHRRLVGLVLELPEPWRGALLARYVEGLPPREIARRSGEPVKTVKSRVARGLERLRERLDAEEGGDRRKWLAALAPVAGIAQGSAPPAATGTGTGVATASAVGGGLLMATKAKAAAVVAVLLAGGAVWLVARPGAGDAGLAVSGGGDAASGKDASLAAQPKPAAAPAGNPGGGGVPASPAGGTSGAALVRVVERADAGEKSISWATVLVRTTAGAQARGTTGTAGEPARVEVAPEAAAVVWAWAEGFAPARVERPAGVGAALDVVLARGKPVAVSFTSASDPARTLTAEEVRARYGGARAAAATLVPAAEIGGTAPKDMLRRLIADPATWSVAGEVAIEGDAPRLFASLEGPEGLVLVTRPGDEPYLAWVEQTESGGLRVKVPLKDAPAVVRLRVVEAESGAPVPRAVLTPYAEAGDDALFLPGPAVTADARGEADLPLPAAPAPSTRSATWWVTAPGRAGVVDPFALPRAGGGSLTLRLPLTATARGHAWTGAGAPAGGKIVASGWKGRFARTTVAPDGTYELAGIPVREPRTPSEGTATIVLVEDAATAAHAAKQLRAKPGETVEVDLGRPAGGDVAVIRGRVTAGGRPLPNQHLGLPTSGDGRRLTTTDADGRFRLDGVPAGEHAFIVLLGEPGIVDDLMIKSLRPLKLAVGDDRVLDFDLPPGTLRVRLLDDKTGLPLAGAIAFGVPKDDALERGRFPGFELHSGWVAVTDAQGYATLLGLVVGAPHKIEVGTKDRRLRGEAEALPTADPAAAEVVIRLK